MPEITFRFIPATVSQQEHDEFVKTAHYAYRNVFGTTHTINANPAALFVDKQGVTRHIFGIDGQQQFSAIRWAELDKLFGKENA